ncbi:hypothetical protein ACGFZJ_36430 [Streptomyces sp. NPDC048253]|uniref:hypothetical protein n=1 Tax=Streptomyces sp. NPDC048253 TaxID=3365524 RepID=UPI0037226E75
MPGTVLLLAASPMGKGCLVDAASVLPVLAAVPPPVLAGTDTANVVELADPLDPQAVLTRLRAAAVAPGPLTLFVAGQLQLDRRQRLPHLALARTTPPTVRYTAFPWHWFREELRLRAPGSTTLVLDLRADPETWDWLRGNTLDCGPAAAVYGRIAPPPGRRAVAAPSYMRAVATILRSGGRPAVERLHQAALARIAGDGEVGDLVLTPWSTPTTSHAPAATHAPLTSFAPPTPGVPAAFADPGASRAPLEPAGPTAPGALAASGAPVASRAPLASVAPVAPGVAAAPGDPGASLASLASLAPVASGVPVASGDPGASRAPLASLAPPTPGVPAAFAEPGASRAPLASLAPAASGVPAVSGAPMASGAPLASAVPDAPGVSAASGKPLASAVPAARGVSATAPAAPLASPTPATSDVPGVPGAPTTSGVPGVSTDPGVPADPGAPAVPGIPADPHVAISTAVRDGRHGDADVLAARLEQAAAVSWGVGSEEALHWGEVRADLAMFAGDAERSCRTWMAVAVARLEAGQPVDAPSVEAAVDRAHHQWGRIPDVSRARALGPEIARLRGRVPGRREGALDHVRQQLRQLQTQG